MPVPRPLCQSQLLSMVAQPAYTHTSSCDLTLVLKIALVPDNDDGEVILVLYPQNLLLKLLDFLKALLRGDAVHQKETFARAHVLLSHCAVLLLTCSIEDVQQRDLVINDALLAV